MRTRRLRAILTLRRFRFPKNIISNFDLLLMVRVPKSDDQNILENNRHLKDACCKNANKDFIWFIIPSFKLSYHIESIDCIAFWKNIPYIQQLMKALPKRNTCINGLLQCAFYYNMASHHSSFIILENGQMLSQA